MGVRRRCTLLLAALALATGCRERQLAAAPAVAPAGEAAASRPGVAEPFDPGFLGAARGNDALCSLDRIDDTYAGAVQRIDGRAPVRLRGWFGTNSLAPAGAFRIVLASGSSAWSVPARTGDARPDTAAFFDAPAMGLAGFDRSADLSPLPAGEYRVVLLADSPAGATACDTQRRLELDR